MSQFPDHAMKPPIVICHIDDQASCRIACAQIREGFIGTFNSQALAQRMADQVTAGTLDGRFEAGLEALLTGLASRRGRSGS